jgi:hypothetical protein
VVASRRQLGSRRLMDCSRREGLHKARVGSHRRGGHHCNGSGRSYGDVTHLAVTDAYATPGMIVFGRNPVRHGIALSHQRRREKSGLELVAIPPRFNALQTISSVPANGHLGSRGLDFLIWPSRGRYRL